MSTPAAARALLMETIRGTTRNIQVDRAAVVAYFQLFAALPFMLAILELLGRLHLGGVVRALGQLIDGAFPPALAGFFSEEMARIVTEGSSQRLILAIATALYAGQRSVVAMVAGVAQAWQVSNRRGAVAERAVGTLGALAVLVATLVAAFLLTLGTWMFSTLHEHGFISYATLAALAVLRLPLVMLLLHTIILVIYRLGAHGQVRGLWTAGSLLNTAAWVLLSQVFEIYLERVTDLGATYGSLGAAVGLLMYSHAVALCVLVGAELDAARARLTG